MSFTFSKLSSLSPGGRSHVTRILLYRFLSLQPLNQTLAFIKRYPYREALLSSQELKAQMVVFTTLILTIGLEEDLSNFEVLRACRLEWCDF
ncbi:hypothetical protein VNO77_20027 [Canavalia gladiata]|uniref:Uncharacterized protein n=1 Tax=Canavalia gladiata TaxID=3824 RepID=A0AAN9QJ04_CANGL